MSEDELRAGLIALLERQSEIARRALDAEKQALATVERAQEAHTKAYEESIGAQRARNATKRALKELGWGENDD